MVRAGAPPRNPSEGGGVVRLEPRLEPPLRGIRVYLTDEHFLSMFTDLVSILRAIKMKKN